jgi:hypothetical protein
MDGTQIIKVCIFWEGHKILQNLIFSEKATKFCKIFALFETVCTVGKGKVKISQNFVAFSENMNFTMVFSQKNPPA